KQSLSYIRGQRGVVEERRVVEPHALARVRVGVDGTPERLGPQAVVSPPLELDRPAPAVFLDRGPGIGVEELTPGNSEVIMKVSDYHPAPPGELVPHGRIDGVMHLPDIGERSGTQGLGRLVAVEIHQPWPGRLIGILVVQEDFLAGRVVSGG